jgi:hypothetical protein
MAVKKGKKRTITVDMEGVEAGGQIVDDGTYPAVIHEVEEKESSSGNPMLVVKWKITGKKSKGALLWDNVSLTPQALWRLKGLLESLGEDVPDSSLDLDLDDLIGKEAQIAVENETFEGKQRPRVVGYASTDDKGSDDEPEAEETEDEPDAEEEAEDEAEETEVEEDEKPAKKPGKKPVFVKNSKVKFRDEKGKTVKGKIISIEGDTAKVKDATDDLWELDVSDLELQ